MDKAMTIDEAISGIGFNRARDLGDVSGRGQKIFALQAEDKLSKGHKPAPDISDGELATVEGKFKLIPAAAQALAKLLADARADLKRDSLSDPALATEFVGMACTYRSNAHDLAAWKSVYNGKAKEYSDDKALLTEMIKKKAVPGFSDHTRGIAVDFRTGNSASKVDLGPSSADNPKWRKSWFFQWLNQNAKSRYAFENYEPECWHWAYRGPK